MVIFDIGLSFGLGCAIKKYSTGEKRFHALLASSLGVAPAALIFLNLYPDWDLQYLIPKEALPPWFGGTLVFLIVLASLAGYSCQGRWARSLTYFAFPYCVYCAWSLTRIAVVTSYTDFHNGTTGPFPVEFLLDLLIFGGPAAAIILLSLLSAKKTVN